MAWEGEQGVDLEDVRGLLDIALLKAKQLHSKKKREKKGAQNKDGSTADV